MSCSSRTSSTAGSPFRICAATCCPATPNLLSRNPASLEICALLVREGLQRADVDLRYVGFTIPPEFVVGYGLDAGERFRNLPDVRVYRGTGAHAE
jgi:hypoxanthine-guanine phosphoribosyltransferase